MTENDRNVWDRVLIALKSCKRDIDNQLDDLDEDHGSDFSESIDGLVADIDDFFADKVDEDEETEGE